MSFSVQIDRTYVDSKAIRNIDCYPYPRLGGWHCILPADGSGSGDRVSQVLAHRSTSDVRRSTLAHRSTICISALLSASLPLIFFSAIVMEGGFGSLQASSSDCFSASHVSTRPPPLVPRANACLPPKASQPFPPPRRRDGSDRSPMDVHWQWRQRRRGHVHAQLSYTDQWDSVTYGYTLPTHARTPPSPAITQTTTRHHCRFEPDTHPLAEQDNLHVRGLLDGDGIVHTGGPGPSIPR